MKEPITGENYFNKILCYGCSLEHLVKTFPLSASTFEINREATFVVLATKFVLLSFIRSSLNTTFQEHLTITVAPVVMQWLPSWSCAFSLRRFLFAAYVLLERVQHTGKRLSPTDPTGKCMRLCSRTS